MANTQSFAVAAAAAAAALFAAPAFSQAFSDVRSPMTSFYVAVPLDGATRKDSQWNFGLQFQGSKPYQSVKVDYQTFKFLDAAIAGVEMKYLVVGAVAVGAAVAVAKKDKSQSQSFQQQQAQQAETCAQTTNNC